MTRLAHAKISPQRIARGIINALSLRYMSASEGSAERPKAASVSVKGEPYGHPRAAILKPRAPLTRASRRERLCEADDPGIPPKACARRPPRPDRVTPAGRIGPWTGHATRLRSAGFLGRRISSPRGGTVPVTHPSWERDERSLRKARDAGDSEGIDSAPSCFLLLSPRGEGLPPRSCARRSRAALAQVAWREG